MSTQCLFFPGLGADHRLFSEQQRFFGDRMACPSLIAPEDPKMDLSRFAQSQVPLLREKFPRVRFLVGMSFGGMLSLELAAAWPEIQGVALVSSIRSTEELSFDFKTQEKMSRFVPDSMIRSFMRNAMIPKLNKSEQLSPDFTNLLIKMTDDLDFRFFRWSSKACAEWNQSWEEYPRRNSLSILQIHGKNDTIIPIQRTEDVTWVPGGSHLIQWTHSDFVNHTIADWMDANSEVILS